jgi:hypothetical protein
MVANGKLHIKDFGWERIKRQFKALRIGRSASVGIQGSDAEVAHGDYTTNVEIGAVMEFGTKDGTIPSRPFLRSPFDAHQGEYARDFSVIYDTMLAGMNVDASLLLLGEKYRKQVLADIKNREYAEWADSTQAQKASAGKAGDVPLIDTGQLINAISVDVDKGLKRDSD